MQTLRTSLRVMSGMAVSLPVLALAAPAVAQDELPPLPSPVEAGPTVVETAPPLASPSNLPRAPFETETSVGVDGVETVTRTRRIERSSPYPANFDQTGYAPYPGGQLAPAPVVFEREQWLEECRRRTDGRSEKEKGGIIGGLLGAIAGGIIGNRVADGERLAGTLIGAGTGGLAGLLLGNLIGGGKKNDRYDCEAALDGYLQQYGQAGPVFASRTIPYPANYGYSGYGYAPAYAGQYGYAGCNCAQPQQVVWVPVRSEQRQRVIVRETVREELVPATRTIPPAPPSPKLIKQPTRVTPAPAPRPAKLIKQ